MAEKHKHADILYAIANGVEVQFKSNPDQTFWKNWTSDYKSPLSYDVDNWVWRVKPDTVIVNGVEHERPNHVFGLGSNMVTIQYYGIEGQTMGAAHLKCSSYGAARDMYLSVIKPFNTP